MKLISSLIYCLGDRLRQEVEVQPQAIFLNNSSAFMTSLLVWGICLSTTGAALARDVCKDVRIIVRNGTPDTIKITKLEYFDFNKNKFRTEGLLNLFDILEIKGSDSPPVVFVPVSLIPQNLSFVGNDLTLLKITYRHKIGGNKFEPPLFVKSDSFKCTNGITKIVNIVK
jgi:hypothetical protein